MQKYVEALEALNNDVQNSGSHWGSMTDADKDMFLAEWVLDGYEEGRSKNVCSWTLSAVQKVCPRLQLKTAWKVLDAWSHLQPVRQAPAAPPQLIQAMIVLALVLGRPELSSVMLLAYAGLLRIREVLNLRFKDVILETSQVIVCLGQTKSGMEQKVVLQNPTVVKWLGQYLLWRQPHAMDGLVFSISYSSVLRWVKKLPNLLGAGSLSLTTHTFRRSGASELSRQGMALADVMLYGRWLSDRAARAYIRKGEVAVARARTALEPSVWQRILQWANLAPMAWFLYHKSFSSGATSLDVSRLDAAKLAEVEGVLFGGPLAPLDSA